MTELLDPIPRPDSTNGCLLAILGIGASFIAGVLVVVIPVIGVASPFVIFGGSIAAVIWAMKHAGEKDKEATAKYRAALLSRYGGDEDVVDAIVNQTIWQGETAQMVIDSLGRPVAVDQKVLKTKKREVWKYKQTGQNRFALRVTLDNDAVAGWETKG